MVPTGDVTPNGATRCTARAKATGEQCRRWSVAGATVCVVHGGRAPQVRAKAAERLQRQAVERHARMLGVPADIDVETGLLDMIREAAGNVAFYRSLVQELEQGWRLLGGDPLDAAEDVDEAVKLANSTPSIAGRVKLDSLEGKPHVFVAMYDAERDRLARYLKDAATLGIAERRLALAEDEGRRLAFMFRAFIADPELGLTQQQRAIAPSLFRRHWQSIAATAVEVA